MTSEPPIIIDGYTLVNYVDLTLEQKKEVLTYRNHEEVRKWMLDNAIISLENHLSFVDALKNDKSKLYHAVIKEDLIIGCIYIVNWNEQIKKGEWGCFLNPTYFGLGLRLGFVFIKWVFGRLSAKVILASVHKENITAIQLNEILGFKKIEEDNPHWIYRLNRNSWNEIPSNYKTFIKNLNKNNNE